MGVFILEDVDVVGSKKSETQAKRRTFVETIEQNSNFGRPKLS